jgi:hypothetical protein
MKAPVIVNPPLHPVYEDRCVRAVFRPMENFDEGLNSQADPGIRQMVGHEFVWRFAGFRGKLPTWIPADPEDIDAYFETTDTKRPDWGSLLMYEFDLDILRVEKLDA